VDRERLARSDRRGEEDHRLGVCTSKTARFSEDSTNFPAAASPASSNGTIECNDGHAVGGGATLSGAPGDWQLNSTFPIVNSNAWRVFAQHYAGGAVTTSTVFVVCIKGRAPHYRNESKSSSKSKMAVKTACKANEAVIGGGAFVGGSTDEAHLTSTAPIDTRADKDKVPDNGWKAKFFKDSGTDSLDYRVTAICE
jgi:hypothetical protein